MEMSVKPIVARTGLFMSYLSGQFVKGGKSLT